MRFSGKTALVIGGNSGIGLAAVKGLAAEGANVFLTGRNPDTLAEVEREVPGTRAFVADVADIDSIDPVLAAIREAHGNLDVLMVNAGVGEFVPVREVTPEQWDRIHGINLRGAFFAVQKSLPLIGRGGSVVLTGSIGSLLAIPGNVIYATAKAGMIALTRSLAKEVVADGIRVNLVSPGPTETPIINRSGFTPEQTEQMRELMRGSVPMGRMGEAEEIAKAMLFLASDDASFITGIDLFVDGGAVELG